MIRIAVALTLLASAVACAQDSRPTSKPTKQEAEPVTSNGGLTFTAQEGWEQLPPKSKMRVVTYRLPHVEGDAEDAELVVYHFPGSGGSVEDNLKRWYGQWSQPDGKNTADVAETKKAKVSGLDATLVDLPGTFQAETRPGSGERVKKEGWRMLAAIVEAPGGRHFVKCVGPAKTVAKWHDSYRAFLEAIQTDQ